MNCKEEVSALCTASTDRSVLRSELQRPPKFTESKHVKDKNKPSEKQT